MHVRSMWMPSSFFNEFLKIKIFDYVWCMKPQMALRRVLRTTLPLPEGMPQD